MASGGTLRRCNVRETVVCETEFALRMKTGNDARLGGLHQRQLSAKLLYHVNSIGYREAVFSTFPSQQQERIAVSSPPTMPKEELDQPVATMLVSNYQSRSTMHP